MDAGRYRRANDNEREWMDGHNIVVNEQVHIYSNRTYTWQSNDEEKKLSKWLILVEYRILNARVFFFELINACAYSRSRRQGKHPLLLKHWEDAWSHQVLDFGFILPVSITW